MLYKRILPFFIILLFALPVFINAQVTTSSMSGLVRDTDGQSLVGATVTATHQPTGTIYRTSTRTGGLFNISNMNPGGPYTLEVSFVNFETTSRGDIFLNLGETSTQDLVLSRKGVNLTEVTISGTRRAADFAGKGGTETVIGREKIENLPTIGRNLNDYLRAIPQAKITGPSGEGITIAGQNNRFNSFYVDGALNNDVFGLAASGTNGGQTSTPPLSIDAIDQFQVVISPYDASLGNFTGGGINAITRSGTNKIQGSVYYYTRNEKMAGKNPLQAKDTAQRFAPFTNKTYGFRFGGALIKNKLFYFVNAESQRDVRPQPFDVHTRYLGNTKSPADIQRLLDTLKVRGNYDPGTFLDNPETVNSDRIAARIDWNVNEKNKLSLSHRYTNAERYNTNPSSSTAINFGNNGWIQPNNTNSTSLELKSNFGRSSSNRLLVTYTDVRDDRNPIGNVYPRVIINDGTGTGTSQGIIIGPDPSSNINILLQKNLSIFDSYKFNIGRHSLSTGIEYDHNNVKNAFIQRVYGEYIFDNLAQFMNNERPRQFRTGYPLSDNERTDATSAAAVFKIAKAAFFINDEFRVTNNFTLNVGVRADYYKWLTDPAKDDFTNTTAIPQFAKLYNLNGAVSGQQPDIPVSISPRLGFNYKVPSESVVIRGGIGMFTGRIPLVWPGGVYNNNGIFIGGFTANAANAASGGYTAAFNALRFRGDPFNQYTAKELGIGINKGPLNLISKEFSNPKVFRASLGFDKKFGEGWTFTTEALYTKNINEVFYTNLSAQAPTGNSAGPGARLVYPTAALPIVGTANPYDNAILLSNNKGDKGFAYNFSFTIDKRTKTGFNFNANYSYGNSVVVNEATSSVNVSQWQFMETVNGRNNITRSTSDFDQGSRIFAYASKKFTYAKKSLATTISLVYTGQSGAPFSWVYSGSVTRDDASAGGFGGNDLLYIPTSADIQTYLANNQILSNTTGGVTYSPAQQAAALETYIQSNRYLSRHRGEFADRNADRLPFTHIVDLKIAQDVNINFGKNRYQFQVTFDMFNFSNFLNREWGRNYFLGNDQFAAITFAGYVNASTATPSTTPSYPAGTTLIPTYRFNPTFVGRTPWGVSSSAIPSLASRWIGQLGIRFNFN